MTDLSPFDPDDPSDAIADAIRRAVGDVALRASMSAVYLNATSSEQAKGFISGMMVGSLGAIIAITKPGQDAELRAALRAHLADWFDVALSLNGRDLLGGDN